MGQALLAVLFQLSEVLFWFFFLVERGWARPRSPPRAVNSRWHPRAGLRPSCTSRSPLAVLGCPGRVQPDRGGSKIPFQVAQGPTNRLGAVRALQYFILVERHPRGAQTAPRSWDRAGVGSKRSLVLLPQRQTRNIPRAGSCCSSSRDETSTELLSLNKIWVWHKPGPAVPAGSPELVPVPQAAPEPLTLRALSAPFIPTQPWTFPATKDPGAAPAVSSPELPTLGIH